MKRPSGGYENGWRDFDGMWIVLAVIAAVLWIATPARAHSWYGYVCCSDKDCTPVEKGEVTLGEGGWFINPTGETIPFSSTKIKKSQDVQMHRCVKPDGTTRCLYVPDPGI